MVKHLIIIVAGLICYFAIPIRVESDFWARGIIIALMFGILGYTITRQIGTGGERIGILIDLLIAAILGCALACHVLAVQEPGQFSDLNTKVDALYFTLTTMSTVGFGDIHAVGQHARILVIVMMIFDLIFLAALGRAIADGLQHRQKVKDD